MRINWNDISADEFEEIVAALLRAMNYENVTLRTGSSDQGWDIDAVTVERDPDGTVRNRVWRIECKRYKQAPPPLLIRDHCIRMVETPPQPDDLLFVVSSRFGNPLKEDLKHIAKRKRVALHIWERATLEKHVFDNLEDPALRSLLVPFIQPSLSMDVLRVACKRQVESEIQCRVGRKYLPDLYQNRPIEREALEFISHDTQKAQLQMFVSFLNSWRWPKMSKADREKRAALITSVGELRSLREARSLLEELSTLAKEKGLGDKILASFGTIYRKCFLVKDKAGSGKTNVFCRLATDCAEDNRLSMFLSCKFDLPSTARLADIIADSLLPYVEDQVRENQSLAKHGNARDFLNEVVLTLEKNGSELVIFLDGINENRDLAGLDAAILSLFSGWNFRPVRFVVSCRDIFWSFFSYSKWERFLYKNTIFDLPEFESQHIDHVIAEYFKKFDIRGQLVGQAHDKCRHPLLLRFFCEAYSGENIRVREDIRLKDLFEVYWARKCQEISSALGWGQDGGCRVEEFVFSIADWMSSNKTTQVALGYIPTLTDEQDIESERSIYKRLRDQDIILEELPPDASFDRSYRARRISFVYDEFYDYIVALAYVRKKQWDERSPNQVCMDFAYIVRESMEFEQLRGVAEYLILMAEQKELHQVLCAILARMGEYDILCNILPKLRCKTAWMPGSLRACLLVVERESRRVAKQKVGEPLSFDGLIEILNREKPESLYEALLSL